MDAVGGGFYPGPGFEGNFYMNNQQNMQGNRGFGFNNRRPWVPRQRGGRPFVRWPNQNPRFRGGFNNFPHNNFNNSSMDPPMMRGPRPFSSKSDEAREQTHMYHKYLTSVAEKEARQKAHNISPSKGRDRSSERREETARYPAEDHRDFRSDRSSDRNRRDSAENFRDRPDRRRDPPLDREFRREEPRRGNKNFERRSLSVDRDAKKHKKLGEQDAIKLDEGPYLEDLSPDVGERRARKHLLRGEEELEGRMYSDRIEAEMRRKRDLGKDNDHHLESYRMQRSPVRRSGSSDGSKAMRKESPYKRGGGRGPFFSRDHDDRYLNRGRRGGRGRGHVMRANAARIGRQLSDNDSDDLSLERRYGPAQKRARKVRRHDDTPSPERQDERPVRGDRRDMETLKVDRRRARRQVEESSEEDERRGALPPPPPPRPPSFAKRDRLRGHTLAHMEELYNEEDSSEEGSVIEVTGKRKRDGSEDGSEEEDSDEEDSDSEMEEHHKKRKKHHKKHSKKKKDKKSKKKKKKKDKK